MSKTFKRVLSILLCAVFLFGAVPLNGFVGLKLPSFSSLFATTAKATDYGACGENLTWEYDTSTATLTISGTGKMEDYSYGAVAPWKVYYYTMKIVVINNGVTSIGAFAFFSCINLTSVTIPDSVTSIGEWAFDDCTGLTDITIPDSVTNIGNSAFGRVANIVYHGSASGSPWGTRAINGYVEYPLVYTDSSKSRLLACSAAYSGDITIPDSVTSIGDSVFAFCKGLTSVTIPDSVTSIGKDAFEYCTDLTSITIGNGVMSVGEDAFHGCTGLANVTIGNSVTSIGEDAFYGCTDLTNVTIGNSVTSIGEDAFYGCTGLTNVTIPDSVTSIGNFAFGSVANIIYHGSASGSPWGARAMNGYVEYPLVYSDSSKTSLLACSTAYTGDITIPDSVMSIGSEAFLRCTGLTSVTICNGITSIGYHVFDRCTGLTSVTIPDNVTSIGVMAFYECISLTSVTIPDSVTSIGYHAFDGCSGLTNVTIGNSVTSIDESAFEGCTSLTSVIIPDSVTSIGWCAFRYCTGLTSVTIPESVTKIDTQAFANCFGLTAITVDSANSNYCSDDAGVLYNKDKTELIQYPIGNLRTAFTIPDSVTSISASAFEDCTSLTSVIIPDSVMSIGVLAFGGCTGLTSVIIPDSVTSIDEGAFEGCTGLTSVIIPDSVTYIIAFAFSHCTGLTSVTIPDSVTGIDEGAFEGCTSLTSVTIPNGVTHIGWHAFGSCTGLTSVIIPESVTNIRNQAFEGCSDDLIIFGYPDSCAETYANDNNITFIPIDNTPYVTLHCPQQTDSAVFEAYGAANPSQTVSVYDGEALLGTAAADAKGRWKGNFTLTAPVDLSTHTITAKLTVNEEPVSDSQTLKYDTNAIYPIEFTLTHNGKTIDCLNVRTCNLSIVSSLPMAFKVKLNHSVSKLWVTGTKNGEVKKIEASYDGNTGAWTAEGWFDPANHNYVPGTLGLEVNDGEKLSFEPIRIYFLIDPSGYVYEAVKSNRVEGATATVQYKLGEAAISWDANRYEQDNPQTTDSLGMYHWDVTEGEWQVKVAKAGYETAYSDWLTVPPEWTEVAIPLVCKAAPKVERIVKNGDSYTLTFDRYMDLTTVNNANIRFSNGNGRVNAAITPLDEEASGTDVGVSYARTFALKPAGTVIDISIRNVKSYAGTAIAAEYTQQLEAPTAQAKIKSVSVGDVTINYKSSTTLKPQITADEGVKYTVKYESSNPKVVTVDANGKVTGAKKGTATITCTVTDSYGNTVKDTCKVTVNYTVWQWIIIILLFGWIWY